jgi:hypothetical protein
MLALVGVGLADDAVFQMRHVEIEHQAVRFSGEFDVRQKLRFVDGKQRLYAFQFDDDRVLDEDVDSESALDRNAGVRDRHLHFNLDAQAGVTELVDETRGVRRFEQSWAKCGMHFHRALDDPPCELIDSGVGMQGHSRCANCHSEFHAVRSCTARSAVCGRGKRQMRIAQGGGLRFVAGAFYARLRRPKAGARPLGTPQAW